MRIRLIEPENSIDLIGLSQAKQLANYLNGKLNPKLMLDLTF